MLAGYSFRPRVWALALAAAGCAAFILLGNWQTRRADEKRALGAQMESRRVSLAGVFLPQHTVFVDNRVRKGRPGYEVLTPLRLTDGRHVLVNRGWIAAAPTRDVLPAVTTPDRALRMDGFALDRLPHVFRIEEKGRPGKVRQSVEVGAFSKEIGLALEPRIVEQHTGPEDGLLRDWPRPDSGVEKHQAYALQWYSLAALAVILAIVLSFRRVEPR
jgi:surfeit locus 1 family protein